MVDKPDLLVAAGAWGTSCMVGQQHFWKEKVAIIENKQGSLTWEVAAHELWIKATYQKIMCQGGFLGGILTTPSLTPVMITALLTETKQRQSWHTWRKNPCNVSTVYQKSFAKCHRWSCIVFFTGKFVTCIIMCCMNNHFQLRIDGARQMAIS